MKKTSGTRVLLNLSNCKVYLKSQGIRKILKRAVRKVKLTARKIVVDKFPDGTANIYVGLEESHIAGGTYGDDQHVALEIVVCNYKCNNKARAVKLARLLAKKFKAKRTKIKVLTWEAA